jgi:uncharacterized damage-inducible protein DinB
VDAVSNFIQYLGSIHRRTKAVVNAIPPEKIDWTYFPGKFTLGDLVRHIALIERHMFVNIAQNKKSTYTGCSKQFAATFAAIIELYDSLHEESVQIISGFDDSYLDEKCVSPTGATLSVRKWLRAMVEHEIHHRGQLYVYLSMLGIKTPPVFGLTSEQLILLASVDSSVRS